MSAVKKPILFEMCRELRRFDCYGLDCWSEYMLKVLVEARTLRVLRKSLGGNK